MRTTPRSTRSAGLTVFVALIAVIGIALSGCGPTKSAGGTTGSSTATSSSSMTAVGTSSGQNTAMATTSPSGACSKVGTVKLAKTKLLLHGGLAFGAFHRYLYKPFKAGTFKSGADGRVKALIKGGAAALFVVHELKYVKQDAESIKHVCSLTAPLTSLSTGLAALGSKFKSGKATDADVNQLTSVNGVLDTFKSGVGKDGIDIKDRTPPSNLTSSDGN